MSIIQLPSSHYFYSSAGKTHKICQPLFTNHQFAFFDYARNFKNGDFYGLSTNSDSFRIFFELEYETLKFCSDLFSLENDRFYYFFCTPNTSADADYIDSMQKVYKKIGIDHGFIILRKHDYYIDVFFFSSVAPHDIAINYFLNQIPILIRFINHFQVEAAKLLIKSSENRIILPNKMRPNIWTPSSKKISAKIINLDKEIPSLTNREIECAKYIARGYTAKETAQSMHLSVRTVEHHLEHIKFKLKVKKKSDLVKYFLQNQNFNFE